MELRVLGPLEARVNDEPLPLGTRKQHAVLAMLAVHANQVVGIDEFVDELWHEQNPPPSAVSNVRWYVGNLRRLFHAAEVAPGRVGRRGGGFVLHAEPDELDLLAFEDECRNGRDAAGGTDLTIATKLFAAATARWRGQMLAGLARGPILAARCAGIESQRLGLVEQLAELHLDLGEPDKAVPSMYEQVQAHPLRERAHAILIRALYETGDAGAALSAYAAIRAILAEELGIEPGPELELLHRAILNRDTTSVARSPGSAKPVLTPRALPADIGHLVGRADEAGRVKDALTQDRSDRHRPAVAILYGTGGVGKSALAIHLAYKIMDLYPDGQLYVDLRGSTPGLRSFSPVEGIRHLLRSLGTPNDEIPDEQADAEARLRSVTIGGRYLLVLDNAVDAEQIQPLLPSTNSCAVIVTARQPLASLDADLHLHLGTLPTDEGMILLQQMSGGAAIDPTTAETIVNLCGHLPLALRIAAGRLLSRPDLAPSELARRLADRERRLDELELEGVAVRSCIRVGYEALASSSAQVSHLAASAFRALGLLSVPDATSSVVAAMLAEPESNVVVALDRLVSAQLLTAGDGRYSMHDLVRLVAAELAAEKDAAPTRTQTLHRALAHYAATVEQAAAILRPGRSWLPGTLKTPLEALATEFATPNDARDWLDANLSVIAAATEQAGRVDHDDTHFTLRLVASTHIFLWERNEWQQRHRLARLALGAEQAQPNRETAGWAHLIMGQAEFDLGNHDAAIEHFEIGLAVLNRVDSAKGVALALNALAIAVAIPLKDPATAISRFNDCLLHTRQHGLVAQEGSILQNLGNLKATLGRWNDAKVDLDQALALAKARVDRNLLGSTHGLLAVIHCALGDLASAAQHAGHSVACSRETGDIRRECHAWLVGAEIHLRGGDYEEAFRHARAALSLARDCRYAYAEAAALRQYARAATLAGQHSKATELHAEAGASLALLATPPDPLLESVLA